MPRATPKATPKPTPKASARMTVEELAIDRLHDDPRNARLHPRSSVEAIARSLQRFGQQKPIVIDADGQIIAGHGTVAAARALGWDRLAAVRTPLRGREAVAYALADNRTAELSGWDDRLLVERLGELIADESREGPDRVLDALGWSDLELERLLNAGSGAPDSADETAGSSGDGGASGGATVRFTADQWTTVGRAVARLRERDEAANDARALELIAADFLAGVS